MSTNLLDRIPDTIVGPQGDLPAGETETDIRNKIRSGEGTKANLYYWIQEAIKEARTSGSLIVPGGRYAFDKSLVVSGYDDAGKPAKPIAIIGTPTSELFYRGAEHAVILDRAGEVNISDIRIIGQYRVVEGSNSAATLGGYPNAKSAGLHCYWITGCKLTNVRISNFPIGFLCHAGVFNSFDGLRTKLCYWGAIISDPPDSTDELVTVFEFRSCYFLQCVRGLQVFGMRGGSFYNCCFEHCLGEGVRVFSRRARAITFYSCYFEDNCATSPEGTWQGIPIAGEAQIFVGGDNANDRAENITLFHPYIHHQAGIAAQVKFNYCKRCRLIHPSVYIAGKDHDPNQHTEIESGKAIDYVVQF